jgi:hypothetical protein
LDLACQSLSNTPLNNTNQTNQNKTLKTNTRLNATTNATEAIDKQQRKQLAASVKNVLSSMMMDIHCPKHVGVF